MNKLFPLSYRRQTKALIVLTWEKRNCFSFSFVKRQMIQCYLAFWFAQRIKQASHFICSELISREIDMFLLSKSRIKIWIMLPENHAIAFLSRVSICIINIIILHCHSIYNSDCSFFFPIANLLQIYQQQNRYNDNNLIFHAFDNGNLYTHIIDSGCIFTVKNLITLQSK